MGIDRSGRASKRPNLFISRFPHHPVQRRPLLSAISTSTSTQPRTQNRFAHPSRPDGDPGLGTWPRRRRAVPFRLPACGCAPDLLPRDGHARSRCQPKGAVPVRLLYWQRGGPAEGSMTAGAPHAAADQSRQKTLAGCVATTGRVRVGDVGVGSWPVACGLGSSSCSPAVPPLANRLVAHTSWTDADLSSRRLLRHRVLGNR